MKFLVEYEIAGENRIDAFECASFFDRYRPKGTKPSVTVAAGAVKSIRLEEDGDALEAPESVATPASEPE
jgi:hypothetical protein